MPPKAAAKDATAAAAAAPPPAPPPVAIPELPRGARWVAGQAPAAWGVCHTATEALKLYTPRRLFRHDFLLISRLMGLYPHPQVLEVDAPAPGLGEPESAVQPRQRAQGGDAEGKGEEEGAGAACVPVDTEPEEVFFKLDPTVAALSLRNASLSAAEFDALVGALSVSTNITSLSFFNCGLSVEQLARLGDVLNRKTLPQLVSVAIDCNAAPAEGGFFYAPPPAPAAEGAAQPAPAGGEAPAVAPPAEPVHALARLLDRASGSVLTQASFRGCGLGPADGAALGTALRFNSACTDLLLSNNALGDEGAVALLAGVRDNKGLVRLSLSGNGLTAAAAAAIAGAVTSAQVPGPDARALLKAEAAAVEAIIKAEFGAAAFDALSGGGGAPAAGRPGSGGKAKPAAGKGAPPPGPDPAVAAAAAAIKLRTLDTVVPGTPPAPVERPPTPKGGKAPAPKAAKDAPPPPPPAPWERFNDDGVYRAWGCPTLAVLDISGNVGFGLTPSTGPAGPAFGFRALVDAVAAGLALPPNGEPSGLVVPPSAEDAAPGEGGAPQSAPLRLKTLVASRCVPAGLRLEQQGGEAPVAPLQLHTEHSSEVLAACGVAEAVEAFAALGATLVTGVSKVA